MQALYLIVMIGEQLVALPAEHVESVVELDEITPVPRVAPHVAGLAALRSRVLTIIDSLRALDLGVSRHRQPYRAVVVTFEGHQYGLLVDRVDDVVEIRCTPEPVRVRLVGGWARAATRMIEHDGETLLLVEPGALIAGPALAA